MTYPFSRALYDDPNIVYHGTSSTFAVRIEAEGLIAGVPRFPIEALRELMHTCDAIGFRSWCYTTIKGLSAGTRLSQPDDRCVYLSANFWYARDYATNRGGETVHNALRLTDELLRWLPARAELGEYVGKVSRIQDKLLAYTAAAFPIVYAVRVDSNWLRHKGKELEREQFPDFAVT